MSEFFLGVASSEDIDYDGYFDGQQKTIPDNEELECVVIDGFNGMQEGKAIMECFVQIAIVTPGEFLGQKYRFNAKVYDNDANKRDRALKNLQVLDTQAGSPLGKGRLALTTDNMHEHWVGKSHARIKMGLMITEENGVTNEINFVRGFAYWRDKLPKQVPQVVVEAQKGMPSLSDAIDEDIDF